MDGYRVAVCLPLQNQFIALTYLHVLDDMHPEAATRTQLPVSTLFAYHLQRRRHSKTGCR